jgi:hypothetical protein
LAQLELFKDCNNNNKFEYPSTRYQGSKAKILNWIWSNIESLEFETCLDAFGGTGSVGYFLKRKSGLFILDYEHADLFEEIKNQTGKFQSLSTVAKLLGCTPKSGTGISAIKLWQDGRFQELRDYCSQDVDTTQEVYLKLREKS